MIKIRVKITRTKYQEFPTFYSSFQYLHKYLLNALYFYSILILNLYHIQSSFYCFLISTVLLLSFQLSYFFSILISYLILILLIFNILFLKSYFLHNSVSRAQEQPLTKPSIVVTFRTIVWNAPRWSFVGANLPSLWYLVTHTKVQYKVQRK